MTRACPYCAEQIQTAAVLCRFCGKTVEPMSPAPTSAARPILLVLLFALLLIIAVALLYAYRSQAPGSL